MRRLYWGRTAWLSVGLAALLAGGCDDGDSGTTPVADMVAGGEDGGGAGGDDLGGAGGDMGGEGGDMGGAGGGGPCDCAAGCRDAQCVEVSPCAADTGCQPGRICEAGACVAGCTPATECPMDRPICVEGRCGDCRNDDDCFGAATCGPERVCVAPAQCTSSRECRGGAVCDGDTGDCVAPFDCREDGFACPGAFTCLAEVGECTPVFGGCSDIDECAFGEVCAGPVGVGACGPCAGDADCPGAARCAVEAGVARCVEPSECTGDVDCAGSRVCSGGLCATPTCPADAFGGNDSLAAAAPLAGDVVHRGLFNCGADWFSLTIPTGVGATVVVRQLDRGADLRLRLTTADGRTLETADGRGAVEAAVLAPVVGERNIRVVVEQVGPAGLAAYDLEVHFAGGAGCVDDGNEAGAGDNTPETGRVLRNQGSPGFGAPAVGRLCAGNLDYVCFWMEAGENFNATADVTGNGTVVGELFSDADRQTVLASGTWGGPAPMDLQAVVVGGRHCIRLSSETGGVTYRLTLTAFSARVDALCQGAAPLPLDGAGAAQVNASLPRERENTTSPRCSATAANAGERVYSVTVDGPRLLTATARGLGTGSLGDPVLSVRQACRLSDSEIGCSTGSVDAGDPALLRPNPAVLRAALPAAGTYSVLVDGVNSGADPTFSLSLQTTSLAAAPVNDTCETARNLALPAGVTEVEVNLDQATDAVVGCLGSGAPDAVWRVVLDAPARINAQVYSQPDEFPVGVYLTSRCGGLSPTACGYGFDQVVPAGEHFLVIDGGNRNSRGRVVARFEVTPLGAPPVNETCETAIALEGPSGTVSGDTRAAADNYQQAAGNACTRHDSRGGDVAYRLPVQAGVRVFVHAEPVGGWDLSLYAVPNCGNLANQCVGSDGALDEGIVLTPAANGEVFVVVDGSGGERGAFNLSWGVPGCERDADCGAGSACVRFACVAR